MMLILANDMAYSPSDAAAAAAAVIEAAEAGIGLIVVVTEGIPMHDEAQFYNRVRRDFPGSRILGPNCPGLLTPGECNIGFIPAEVARAGGAVVWEQRELTGVAHPTPDDADAFGCRWPVSVQVPVGADWPSGVYLVTMRAHGAAADRATGHALFVVRAPRPTSKVLLVLSTNTYNALY